MAIPHFVYAFISGHLRYFCFLSYLSNAAMNLYASLGINMFPCLYIHVCVGITRLLDRGRCPHREALGGPGMLIVQGVFSMEGNKN